MHFIRLRSSKQNEHFDYASSGVCQSGIIGTAGASPIWPYAPLRSPQLRMWNYINATAAVHRPRFLLFISYLIYSNRHTELLLLK